MLRAGRASHSPGFPLHLLYNGQPFSFFLKMTFLDFTHMFEFFILCVEQELTWNDILTHLKLVIPHPWACLKHQSTYQINKDTYNYNII